MFPMKAVILLLLSLRWLVWWKIKWSILRSLGLSAVNRNLATKAKKEASFTKKTRINESTVLPSTIYVLRCLKIDVVTAHLPCDLVKFCVLLKGFVWATWGSDMEILYKIRNEVFFLARKNWNLYHFLDPRYFTLEPRQKTYTRKKFTFPIKRFMQEFYAVGFAWRIE